jgi:hypothetical protein
MNKASLDHWSRLSPLLDVALDMDASERDVWLDTLPAEMDDLKPHLRRLLTPRPGIETSNYANLAPVGQVLLADEVSYLFAAFVHGNRYTTPRWRVSSIR